ncbi:acylphosphatase [Shouchella clausii]|uniref:acylphosphatase n=1 Tax=Shouchella clausii TaxID=79880 RepID=UPI00280A7340|nr:acylphosphatase [Shouchella clausii]WMM31761.1 acylphosphatase [Shouchella clausii]
MKRYEVEVTGRVQGVGFRVFVEQTASQYPVTGTVQNRPEGSVVIQVQGEETEIEQFLAKVGQGNHFAKVEHMEKKEIPKKEKEGRFSTIY